MTSRADDALPGGAAPGFTYSTLSGRPPGRVVRTLARFLRGVEQVQAQVEPFARAWDASNRDAVQQVAAGQPWWAVLGDSMSQGVGASTPERGWVGLLRDDVDLPLVNLSFTGARIGDVLERQLPTLEDLVVAHRSRPRLVVLMIGNNDMHRRRWRREIPTAMADLLRRVPRGTVVATQPGAHGSALQLNAAVDAAAVEGRVRVAEFRVPELRSWRGRVAADHFHPNDAGYAAMAEVVRRALPPRTPGR